MEPPAPARTLSQLYYFYCPAGGDSSGFKQECESVGADRKQIQGEESITGVAVLVCLTVWLCMCQTEKRRVLFLYNLQLQRRFSSMDSEHSRRRDHSSRAVSEWRSTVTVGCQRDVDDAAVVLLLNLLLQVFDCLLRCGRRLCHHRQEVSGTEERRSKVDQRGTGSCPSALLACPLCQSCRDRPLSETVPWSPDAVSSHPSRRTPVSTGRSWSFCQKAFSNMFG